MYASLEFDLLKLIKRTPFSQVKILYEDSTIAHFTHTITECENEVKGFFKDIFDLKSFYKDIDNFFNNVLEANAFNGCMELTHVKMSDDITEIKLSAFDTCPNLKSVMIGKSVTEIGRYAFSSCESLKSVFIPNSVTCINEHAFSYCDELKSINIPESVTTIFEYAFTDCESLEDIVIPSSVKTIGHSAFGGCKSLKRVHYIGTEKEWKEVMIGTNNGRLLKAKINFYTKVE